jgi:hypothetical protein
MGSAPILFGPVFAVRLAGLDGLQYFSKVWLPWPYGGMYSLDVRSINRGYNHSGD